MISTNQLRANKYKIEWLRSLPREAPVLTADVFTPSDISGLLLWLDANQSEGLIDGEGLALWTNRARAGQSVTQWSAISQPMYRTNVSKGKPGIYFDGVTSYMNTPVLDLSITPAITILVAVYPETTSAGRFILDTGFMTNPSFAFYQDQTTHTNSFVTLITGNVGFSYSYNAAASIGPQIVGSVVDISTIPDTIKMYVDGNYSAYDTTLINNTNTGLSNSAITIGRRKSAAQYYYKGYLFEVLLYNRALTDVERVQVENYLMDKWFYSYVVANQDNDETDGYASTLSRVKFTTEATALTVDYYTNIYTTYPGFAEMGVLINGTYNKTITPLIDNVTQSNSVSWMSSGEKTIELINGLQSKPVSTRLGTWARYIRSSVPVTLASVTEPSTRIVVYGDSIAAGGNCTTAVKEGWPILVRAAYSGQLAVEAWGFRSLKDDTLDAATIAAFISKLWLAYRGTDIFWLAIGTNDYGGLGWGVGDFQIAYTALCLALHAQFPTAIIYCQSPILRVLDGTLGLYRTAIANAIIGLGYCIFVDGTAVAFPQPPGDLDPDGLHPSTAGHLKYANAVKAILGL